MAVNVAAILNILDLPLPKACPGLREPIQSEVFHRLASPSLMPGITFPEMTGPKGHARA